MSSHSYKMRQTASQQTLTLQAWLAQRYAGTGSGIPGSGGTLLSDGVADTSSRVKGDPHAGFLPAHAGISSTAAELPLPTLGYACLNCTLRHGKPTFFNNRTCRLATIKDPNKVRPLDCARCAD